MSEVFSLVMNRPHLSFSVAESNSFPLILLFLIVYYTTVVEIQMHKVSYIRKLYVAYNSAFRMLFRLPRDRSASGMFTVC